jgi:DNA-binding MarR family transcriptional regulator
VNTPTVLRARNHLLHGSLPFGEIGAKMMVTVSNLTGIVDRLEQKIGFTEARRNRPPGCSPKL